MRIVATRPDLDLSKAGVQRYMTLLRASSLTDEENAERREFLRYLVQPMAWVYWAFLRSGARVGRNSYPSEVFVKRARSYSTNIPLDVWLNSMCREFSVGQPPTEVVEVVNTLSHCSGEVLRYIRAAAVVACGMAITIANEWREESKREHGKTEGREAVRDVDDAQSGLPFRD